MSPQRKAAKAGGNGTQSIAPDGARDPRAAAAENLLHDRGVAGTRVGVAGHRCEIAVVEAPAALAGEIAALAPELKALGFLYVALDLAAAGSDPGGTGPDHRPEPHRS